MDKEWIELIKLAKQLGYTPKEVREALMQMKGENINENKRTPYSILH